MRKLNKKGATSISILLLVIMALILSGAALVSFAVYGKQAEKKIFDARIIENLSYNEDQIRIFLKQIAEFTAKESSPDGKFDFGVFKTKFMENVNKLPTTEPSLKKIVDEVKNKKPEEILAYENSKISVTLKKIMLRYDQRRYENKWVFFLYIIPVDIQKIPRESISVFYTTDIKAEVYVGS